MGVPARPPAGSLPAPAGAASVGLRRLRRRHGRRVAAARQRRRRDARRPHVRRRARLQRRRPGRRGVRAPRPRPRPRLARHRGADPGRRHPARGARRRRALVAGPGTGGLAVRDALGTAARRHRHRRPRRHADPGRRDRPRHAPAAGWPATACSPASSTRRRTRPATRISRAWGRHRPAASSPRGALVGFVGCTGHCFGPHLHFEVRISGRPVDPLPYLAEAADGAPRPDPRAAAGSRSSRAARTPTARTPSAATSPAAAAPRPAARRRPPAACPRARHRAGRRPATPSARHEPPSTRSARSGPTGAGARSSASSDGSPAWRPAASPASSPPKRGCARRTGRCGATASARAAASSRSTSSPAPRRATPSAWHGKSSSPTGEPTSEGARHRVYLATIQRTDDGWAVRRWEPQP